VSISERVRDDLRQRLWTLADDIHWIKLSPGVKSRYYENWTKDPKIGGLLVRFMDKGQVRVYIKDTIMKDYARDRRADPSRARNALEIEPAGIAIESYIKPHGQRLSDGRVICWGRADDWKTILMALHERTYSYHGLRPYGAALTQASGRYGNLQLRKLVENAARKLGIAKIVWLDT
jgi:hypothetical protein